MFNEVESENEWSENKDTQDSKNPMLQKEELKHDYNQNQMFDFKKLKTP